MNGKTAVPMIDLVLLTLGSVLAVMTQMQRVEAIDVDLARVGAGAAAVRKEPFDVVTVTPRKLAWNGLAVSPVQLTGKIGVKPVVMRAGRDLPAGRMLDVLAQLAGCGADVSIEVSPRGDPAQLLTGSK